jgi:hypothetical protein
VSEQPASHSDDGKYLAFDIHRLADDCWMPAELTLPHVERDDDGFGRVRAIVSLPKGTMERIHTAEIIDDSDSMGVQEGGAC